MSLLLNQNFKGQSGSLSKFLRPEWESIAAWIVRRPTNYI
jgi:hypothetical protein